MLNNANTVTEESPVTALKSPALAPIEEQELVTEIENKEDGSMEGDALSTSDLPSLPDNQAAVIKAISRLSSQVSQIGEHPSYPRIREIASSAIRAFACVWSDPPCPDAPKENISEVVRQLERFAKILASETAMGETQSASPSVEEIKQRVDIMIQALNLFANGQIGDAREVASALYPERTL